MYQWAPGAERLALGELGGGVPARWLLCGQRGAHLTLAVHGKQQLRGCFSKVLTLVYKRDFLEVKEE